MSTQVDRLSRLLDAKRAFDESTSTIQQLVAEGVFTQERAEKVRLRLFAFVSRRTYAI